MSQIKPITDLWNTNEISEIYYVQKERVFIIKNAFGDITGAYTNRSCRKLFVGNDTVIYRMDEEHSQVIATII